ncbi:uncharacterized protein LOC129788362 [Lutzomyia longipalpis]|uniref:uncharacterized protein LOC129788362 n=1 Tax=Lutzomyia longipalpis TaxID=7200 RepID=UPI002484079C|nr:uncharacterized protein LOC129788362 [Lutzomyia longipalpis]
MAEIKLSAFRVQRGIHKRTLTRLEKKVSETDTITHRLAASWLTEIQSTLDKFMPIQIEIEVLAQVDPDLCKLEEDEGDAFQDRCMELRLKLEDILGEHQQSSRNHNDTSKDNMLPEVLQNQTNLLQHIVKLQTEGPPSSSSLSARTKLPQLNLPTFNGQYTEWMRFRDAFHSTIHSNPDLRPNQKMQYLKMALTGSAAEDISHVQISDDNYEPTWQRLTKRYEKKVHLINAFIDQFMAQSKQKVDTVDDLLQANRKYRQIFDSMKALGDDCLKLDVWLIYLMKQNMSEKFRTKWEESRDSENMASVDDFFDFMEKATDVMERANLGLQDTTKAPPKGAPKQPEKAPSKPSKGGIATHHTETGKCHKCGGAHPLYQCESFKALPVEERGRFVSKSSLCFNCIRGNHPSKKCTSQSRCRLCGKAHHTLLHIDVQQAQIPKQFVPPQGQPPVAPQSPTVPQQLMPPQDTQTPSTSSMVTTHHSMVPKRALLPTALVNILDAHGNNQVCRVLIDGGGECTMISEDCAQRLLLPRSNAKIPVTGAAEVTVGYTRGLVHLSMSSIHDEDSKLQAEAYVMQKLTAFLPSVPISHMSWPHIDSLKLADPGYKTPGKIDVILGGEYVPYITLPQILKGNNDEPVAQLTIFGWTAAGKIPSEVRGFTSMHTHCDLDDSLKKFWMSENVPSDKKKCYTKEEQFCEDHFAKTHTRDESGRYVVELAFKEDHEELGDSSKAALARLQTMERRFARDPEFKAEYIKFMNEYLQLGHMEEVPYDQLYKPHNKRYFLPHQAVLRPSSETTKLRVVFDASAPTPPNNKSLNDNLAVGPVLQDDLFTILVRHRTYVIAFCADAEKMYRQIGVAIEYRDYLSLFWRPDPSQKIRQYRLKTVTYGTSSAPYLATKVLQQIAFDYASEFPEAARAILSCFYMDDLLCGASNLEEAKKLCKDIQEVLQRAKFTLRKWCSNSSELLADIPSHLQALSPEEVTAQSKTITALGLQWAPGPDELSILTEALPQVITKRDFCAAAAKIFDPLGFLSPFTVKLKMMFQSLWLSGMGWDDALPQELVDTYEDFRTQYSALKELKIRRNIPSKGGVIELHGFADASERAFGAVVYAKGEDSEGNPVIAIVTAKSRVAPVKIVSIPRLELNACLLLATLLDKVKDAITNFEVKVHAWSDSMVALQWIQDSPKRWTPYVANRVSMIHDYFPPSIWRHVSTLDNPADCVSRGLSPTELKDHHLWWQGPQWLLEEESNWPKTEIKKSTTKEERTLPVKVFVTQKPTGFIEDLIDKHSNFLDIVRILAWVKRYVHNLRQRARKQQVQTGELLVRELNSATYTICAHIQQHSFPDEYKCCLKLKPVSLKSKLKTFVPFLDEFGVMRTKGRLRNADVSDATRHPIILPSNHKNLEWKLLSWEICRQSGCKKTGHSTILGVILPVLSTSATPISGNP